jgi:hypothetical protein
LGLEFDEGKRLASDEELIDSDPVLFSSFYNIPCAGISAEELNLIASYFPLMVRFYPRSLMLLSIEYQASVSNLFMKWLRWLKRRRKGKELSLSPAECLEHFGEFVQDSLTERKDLRRKHIPDILTYETACLQVGKFSVEEGSFHIDLQGMRDFKPLKHPGLIVRDFTFDLSRIIQHLKQGDFRENYPPAKTFMVFRQQGGILDVSEINLFTRDFLALSDGNRTVDVIAKRLYPRHGREMDPGALFDACLEAVRVLGDKRLLGSDAPPRFSLPSGDET